MPVNIFEDEPLPPLTDHDVNVLHQIVYNAQEFHADKPPLRALFAVYDEEINTHGATFDPDSVYSDFLLRLRQRNPGNDSLFGRFQAQLHGLGIDVEVDEDSAEVGDITRQFGEFDLGTADDLHDAPLQATTRSVRSGGAHGQRPRSSRSASFSEVHETLIENSLLSDEEREARRDVNRNRSSSRVSDPGGRRRMRPHIPYRHRETSRGVRRGRAISNDFPTESRKRSGSISSQGSLRISRRSASDPLALETLLTRTRSPHPTESDFQSRPESPRDFHVPPHMLYRPSNTEVLDDADTFLHNRTLRLCRRLLYRWRDEAQSSREHNERMLAAAIKFDQDTLLRQPFEIWQVALQEKRQSAETERFFGSLEKRAGRARDLYLLTKAFTHWAQCAADEVQRTNVARRHLLRTKYFNAWKDITAVNELKVRRLGLKKYFKLWKSRSRAVEETSTAALAHYHGNLVERIYRQWFWHFCERRAPVFFAGRLCKTYLHKWLHITQRLRNRQDAVEQQRKKDVQRNTIKTWLSRLQQTRQQQAQADNFRRVRVLESESLVLNRQVEMDRLTQQSCATSDLSLLWTRFEQWRQAASLSVRGRQANEWRLTVNAWNVWNRQLRVRVIQRDVDHRVKAEAMYRWLLATRCRGMQWVHTQHLLGGVLQVWHHKTQQKSNYLHQAARTIHSIRRNRLTRSAFTTWIDQTRKQTADNTIADALYDNKLKSSGLLALSRECQRRRELEELASNAHFYLFGNFGLNRWREALHKSHQRKRREAYSYMRRKMKMSLVADALHTWRDAAARVRNMDIRAVEFAESMVTARHRGILLAWREQSTQQFERNHQAERFRMRKLTGNAMSSLRGELRRLQDDDERAQELNARHTIVMAKTSLRKLNWSAWQLARREDTARALAERFEKQHRVNMIRHWASWANELRRARAPTIELPLRPRDEDNPAFAATRPVDTPLDTSDDESEGEAPADDTQTWGRAEDWTVFDNSVFQDLGRLDLNFDFNVPPQETSAAAPGRTPGPSQQLPGRRTSGDVLAPASELPFAPHEAPRSVQRGLLDPNTPAATPGYLRTPSKRSTAAALSRDRILGLTNRAAGTPAPPLRISRATPRGAMSAPPGRFSTPSQDSARGVGTPAPRTALGKRSAAGFAGLRTPAPVVEEEEADEGITSFEGRLRRGGFVGQQSRGRRGLGSRSSIPRRSGGVGGLAERRVEFEDIHESEE